MPGEYGADSKLGQIGKLRKEASRAIDAGAWRLIREFAQNEHICSLKRTYGYL